MCSREDDPSQHEELCAMCHHSRDLHGTRWGRSCRGCLEIAKPIPVAVQVVWICEEFITAQEAEDRAVDHGVSYRDY